MPTLSKQLFISISVVVVGAVAVTSYIYRRRVRKNGDNISRLKFFSAGNVHIKDVKGVIEKLQKMIREGSEQLQVIADFDRTLSKFSENGVPVPTCHGIFEHTELLPASFREENCQLRDTYYPIEINDKLTREEKIPYMIEWWTKANALLVRSSLTPEILQKIVNDAHVKLRDGCNDLFRNLYRNDVPLLIFSAGIGDVIELVLKENLQGRYPGLVYENIKIISNYMDFNHQGVLVGFKNDIIHTFNKNENALHSSDYFDKIRHRKNILLLGDSTGDAGMAEGASNDCSILKIGFLNDKVNERLELYKDLFDIVLVNDETMSVTNEILSYVL